MSDLIKLTDEEKKVIQEVKRKNFYNRVLPFSIGSMIICRVLIVRGKISSDYGRLKVGGAGLIGFMMGKAPLPKMILNELTTRCPDGEFVKMSKIMNNLTPEEKREVLLSMRKGEKISFENLPGTESSPQYDAQKSTTEPLYDTTDQQTIGAVRQKATSDKTSFSNSEQKANKNVTGQEVTQALTSASDRPSFSYAEQRTQQRQSETPSLSQPYREGRRQPSEPSNINYGDIKPTYQPDTKPLPEDLPSSPGPSRRVRRNQFGDEIE